MNEHLQRLIREPADGVLGALHRLPGLICGLTGYLAGLVRGLSRRVLHLARSLAGGVLRLSRHLLGLVGRDVGRVLARRLVGVLPGLLRGMLQRVLDALVLGGLVDGVPELVVGLGHLLDLLLRAPDRVVSKDELSEKGLGRPREAYDRSVDVHISNIRQKLAALTADSVNIETVRSIGYRIR